MQDLRVIGVENGALLVTTDDGTRYRIPIDEVLQSKLRQSVPDPGTGRKLAPRDIQAHIRSGMSAQDVASITGVPLEYIQKFEGPVLAEREYVITAALNVPVHTAIETDPLGQGSTFGSVIRERLHDLGAIGERWASWKEQGGGWVVKLAFTAEQIDHDARWQFDPKKAALAPLNSEAITLSQQGEMAGALIPRLRAVSSEERVADSSRFDSGAFTEADLANHDTAPYRDPVPFARPGESAASAAAINHEDDNATEIGHTADLLEALRRRRGEREAASFTDHEESRAAHPSTGSIRVIDVPLNDFADTDLTDTAFTDNAFTDGSDDGNPTAPQPMFPGPVASGGPGAGSGGFSPAAANARAARSTAPVAKPAKKGRTSMPSWDDIVFGARSDDDL